MQKFTKIICASVAALAITACSNAADDNAEDKVEVEETNSVATQDEMDTATEVWEVCDEFGNRYPSEADAEAAGLDRAEYGATFCE